MEKRITIRAWTTKTSFNNHPPCMERAVMDESTDDCQVWDFTIYQSQLLQAMKELDASSAVMYYAIAN